MHLIDFSLPAQDIVIWGSKQVGFDEWEDRVMQLPCIFCSGFNVETAPLRQVIRTKVVTRQFDPTEAYVLACGHTVI